MAHPGKHPRGIKALFAVLSESLFSPRPTATALAQSAAESAKNGDIPLARQTFANALHGSNNLHVHLLAIDFHLNLGEVDQAETLLHSCLRMSISSGAPATATFYSRLGDIMLQRGNHDAAEELHRKALASYQYFNHPEGMSYALTNLGIVMHRRTNFSAAEDFFRKAHKLNPSFGADTSTIIRGHLNIASALKGHAAVDIYRHALALSEKQSDFERTARIHCHLIDVLQTLEDLDAVAAQCRAYLEISQQLHNPLHIAKANSRLAANLCKRNDFAAAQPLLRASLDTFEILSDHEEAEFCCNLLAHELQRLNHLSEAELFYRKVLAFNKNERGLEAIAYSYYALGDSLGDRQDFAGALPPLLKALQIYEELNLPERAAYCCYLLGLVTFELKDPAASENFHRKALAINEKIPSSDGIANACVGLSYFYHRRSDLDAAQEMLLRSLTIFEEFGPPENSADCCARLALVLEIRGDLPAAIASQQKALSIHEKGPSQERIAEACSNLGHLLEIQGDLDSAQAMQERALQLNEKIANTSGIALNCLNLGTILLGRDNLDAAQAMFQRAFELNETLAKPLLIAHACLCLGQIKLASTDLDAAEALFRKTIDLSEKHEAPPGDLAVSMAHLGKVHLARADFDAAESLFRKALELSLSIHWQEGIALAHADLGNLMHARNRPAEAKSHWMQSLQIFTRMGARLRTSQVQQKLIL